MGIGNRPAHPSRRVRRPVDYLTQAVPLIPDDQTRLLSIIRTETSTRKDLDFGLRPFGCNRTTQLLCETSTRKDLDFGLRPFGCNRTAQLLCALDIVDMIDICQAATISVRPHDLEDKEGSRLRPAAIRMQSHGPAPLRPRHCRHDRYMPGRHDIRPTS